MSGPFDYLSVPFFTKAAVFPASLGTFRYRFQRSSWYDREDGQIQVWVYENVAFELAEDVETAVFPWTEAGVEQIRQWLEEKLRQRGSQPYYIPYPPGNTSKRSDKSG